MISNTWRANIAVRTYVNPVPIGCVAWYDAAQITGVISGTGLAQWDDLSGNANHAAGVVNPIYQSNQSQTFLPGVSFNGTTQYMRNLALTGTGSATGVTIMVAGRLPVGIVGNRELVSFRNAAATEVWELRSNGGPALQFVANGGITSANTNSGTQGAAYIWTGTYDPPDLQGVTTRMYVSESLQDVGSDVATIDLFDIHLGFRPAADFWNAVVFEILAWKRSLTAQERGTMVQYLKQKWGITT